MSLESLAAEIHETAKTNGFWHYKDGEDQVNQILAKMMLIDTEVSELADAYVKRKGSEEIAKECADVLIRLLDLVKAMASYGIVVHDLDEVLKKKMEYNQTRPQKHNRLM